MRTATVAASLLLAVALASGPVAGQTTASFTVDPADPVTDETVTFRSTSTGEYGEIVHREWRIDGEPVGEGPTYETSFAEPGEYLVELTVRDQEYQEDTTERLVTVAAPNEPPTASLTVDPRNATVNETLTVDASGSTDPGDGLIAFYDFDLDADGEYDRERVNGPRITHSYAEPGDRSIRVRVTDDDGATATATANLTVSAPALSDAEVAAALDVPDVRVGDTVTLDAGGAGGEEAGYVWRIDGEVVSTASRFGHTFGERGEHAVDLTVSLAGGTASATETVTVAPRNATENATDVGVDATLLDAIDADDDGRIGDSEVLEAISYWHDDAAVPGTDGAKLGDVAVLRVIEAWRTGATVPG